MTLHLTDAGVDVDPRVECGLCSWTYYALYDGEEPVDDGWFPTDEEPEYRREFDEVFGPLEVVDKRG